MPPNNLPLANPPGEANLSSRRIPHNSPKPKFPKFIYTKYGQVVITAILMFLVFLIAALIVVQTDKYKQKYQSQSSVSPTPAPIAPIDTSNWKTYRNEKYGFEFKYPSESYETNIDNEEEYGYRNGVDLVEDFKRSQKHPPPILLLGVRTESLESYEGQRGSFKVQPFNVWVFDNEIYELSIMAWVEEYKYYPFQWGDPTPPHKKIKTDFLEGREAYLPTIDSSRLIYIQNNKLMFLMHVWEQAQSNVIGNQILSTFRFTR